MVKFCSNCYSTNLKQIIGRSATVMYECQNCGLESVAMPESESPPSVKKSFDSPVNEVKQISKTSTVITLILLFIVLLIALILGFIR